ncbi:oligosaccharide flippase family protein [Microvirga tunisiensis]|uniref:Oligosaccharide flippase family protein n=1 Tax=Pannonibacter tanglangensis TaxID=2750084 RepID=A0A7X5F1I7_9HYPH|nr:oligosaccharide flippase family protein [Pannonibacter sp. XCT-53]NBN78053.1 oligosaccharide flippase family protein [Pannonibacter sp. XCT-53]
MVSTVASRLIGKTVNFVVFIILARELSVQDMGLYGFIFATSIIVATGFDFGIRNSSAFFIGQSKENANAYAKLTLQLFAVLALPTIAFMYAVLFMHGDGQTDLAISIAVSVNVAALLFIRMAQGILIGEGRIGDFNRSELASRVVLFLATAGILLADQVNILTAFGSLALSNTAAALVVMWYVRKSISTGGTASEASAKTLVGRGIKFMLGVLAMLTAKQMAFLAVSQLGTADDAGVFFALRRITELLTEVGLAVSVVVFSKNVRTTDRGEAIRSAAHSTRVSFALFVLLSIVAFVFAEALLGVVLGEPYASSPDLFRILLIGTLASTIWTIIFPSLSAIDNPMVSFWIFLPNLLFGGICSYVLFMSYGIYGAAWAMLLSHVVITASFLAVFKLRYGASVRDFLLLKRSDFAELAGFSAKIRRRLKL